MKVALISPYKSIASHGVRSLSAFLKEKGIAVDLFFLCLEMDELPSPALCERLSRMIEISKAGLVGISLSTNYFNIARKITEYIKRYSRVPVIWGGIHPTIRPEECLNTADMVCVGEGETALLNLSRKIAEGADYTDVESIYLKSIAGIKKNRLAPLIQDIDLIPFPDYDFKSHFLWKGKDFYAVDEELFKNCQYIADRYETLTSRGCPYRCSYCCNNSLHRLYGSGGFLRKRRPASIVEELEGVKRRFSFIKSVYFDDDAIFSKTREEIEQFCRLYKEKVKLPFEVSGVHPRALSREKLELFIDAGLKRIKMGIQTGSNRISRLYKRENVSNERIMQAALLINRFKDRLQPPIYDFILDNPYEKEEDKIETLNLLFKIPKPYELSLFSLTFFPGNEITEQAERDGFLKKLNGGSYFKNHNRPSNGYFNILFEFCNFYSCPRWVWNIMLNKKAIRLRIHIIFYVIVELIMLVRAVRIQCMKLMRDLSHLDFSRIRRKISVFFQAG